MGPFGHAWQLRSKFLQTSTVVEASAEKPAVGRKMCSGDREFNEMEVHRSGKWFCVQVRRAREMRQSDDSWALR